MSEGKTQEGAAAASGMSERSARTWQEGALPSQTKTARTWRTRTDPFVEVWDAELIPLLLADSEGILEATTLMEVLDERYPKRFDLGQLRTLQRRLRDWRAMHGPDKEVFFQQDHVPGRAAAIDFTHATELGVTIAREPLVHLFFQFVLCFSGWRWVSLAYGETFEALVAGLQGALWALGGMVPVLRSDNLSAATHELKKSGGRALNARFADVLKHYGDMRSSRIEPGKSHENGVAEKANDVFKSALGQALAIRGSKDFDTLADYLAFVQREAVDKLNRRAEQRLALERPHLRPLPAHALPAYTKYHPIVRRWSTIRIATRTYSVPSRLIGHELEVRQHADVVEVFYAGRLVETMPRLRGERTARIDYRHVIWSLVRKPGAFAQYRYREELFPTLVFRRAYDALKGVHGERADLEYLRVLHLAASTMEATVEATLSHLLGGGQPFDYAAVKAIAKPEQPAIPDVAIGRPDLLAYDRLLCQGGAR